VTDANRLGASIRCGAESNGSLLTKLRDENQIWREHRSDSATADGGELSGAAEIAITSNGADADAIGTRATIIAARLSAVGVLTGATSADSTRVGIAQHRVRSTRVGAGHAELQHRETSAPAGEHRSPVHPAISNNAINNVASRFILRRDYRHAAPVATARFCAGFHLSPN
jgi:hypothetical protein